MTYLKRQNQGGQTSLEERSEKFDRLFRNSFWTPFGTLSSAPQEGESPSPKIDIQEINNQIIIKADVPGVEESKLNVEVTESMVYLSGNIEHEAEKTEGTMYRLERESTDFHRDIMLPARINPHSAQATLHNGLLTLTLIKREEEEPRTIEVNKNEW